MSADVIGLEFDNYRITGVLGRGGMGVVYRAKNLALDKDVALKIMDPALSRDDVFLTRFRGEAKSLARLQSPNIVGVYDMRETPLGFGIVMEFVDGHTLAEKLQETRAMPLETALPIFKQLLLAVGHAHDVGVIHRDIKPNNIMVTRTGTVKVTDFGLAKIQKQPSVTRTTMVGGTLRYVPPEQLRGLAEVDRRADIYSLGMTMYEILAGRLPFEDTDSEYAIQRMIVDGKMPRPDKINPTIPAGMCRVIMKAIEKHPDDRYQSAAEMWEAMSHLEHPHAPKVRSRKKPFVIGAALAGAIAALFAVLWLSLSPSPSHLVIVTEPAGAAVNLNGTHVGTSPMEADRVSPGTVRLHLSLPGFQPKDTIVGVAAGASLSLMVKLEELKKEPTRAAARLSLLAIPRGAVSVDGRPSSTETSMMTEVEVSPGRHTVLFTHPQYGSKTVEIELTERESRKITCYFESYVNILARPVWATVVIDGRSTQMETPQARIPLGVGRHRVTVSRSGYETVEGTQVLEVYPTINERIIPLVFNLRRK